MRRHLLALAGLALVWAPVPAAAQSPAAWSVGAPEDERNAPFITVSDLSDPDDLVDTPPPPTPSELGWYYGGFLGTPPVGQNDPRYVIDSPGPFAGVSRLLIDFPGFGTSGCTGTLVNREHLLTAAHCVINGAAVASGSSVTASFFDWTGGSPTQVDIAGAAVYVHPDYDPSVVVNNSDIAIVRLSRAADPWIPSYSLFTGNPLFQPVVLAGYGRTGNGVTGGVITEQFRDLQGTGFPVLRHGLSSWEMTRDQGFLYADFEPVTPILVSDFDGAVPAGCWPVNPHPTLGDCWPAESVAENNTTCLVWQSVPGIDPTLLDLLCHEGFGLDEVSTDAGDSGGPGFIWDDGEWKVAGVASFGNIRCFPSQADPPQTSPGCPPGMITRGGYFGALNGHNAVGFGDNYAFIRQTVVPEPGTLVLLGTGLIGLLGVAHRRRRNEKE